MNFLTSSSSTSLSASGPLPDVEVYISRTEVQEFSPILYRPDHIFDRDMDAGDSDELAGLPDD